MANFCSKCGQKLNPEDKYCPKCGTLVGKEVVKEREVIREEPSKEPPKVKPSGGFLKRFFLGLWNIVRGLFRGSWITVKTLFFIALFLALVYFMFRGISYMAENYPIGESIEKFFEGLSSSEPSPQPSPKPQPNGGTQVSIGCKYCSPGYCWTGQACCPRYAPYYCRGYCYKTQSEAYRSGCHESYWKWYCCP